MEKNKPGLLLHICCVGCGVYISQLLKEEFEVTLFFYNPNIYPREEYEKRLEEAVKIAKQFDLPLIHGEYEHVEWLKTITGYEQEPERGERCRICYRVRLEKTAQLAKKNGIGYFATTLSISPHKDAGSINTIGNEIAVQYGIKFLERDFKKNDGFKKSAILTKELKLYRQNYCGCEFSIKK